MRVDVVIIGAGPAGMSCAIQLKRMGVKFVLLEKDRPGGLLHNAYLVENYPGFPGGISGSELIEFLVEHVGSLGIEIDREEVKKLSYSESGFDIETDTGSYSSKVVVLATGTKPREIADIDIPQECLEKIFYEVTQITPAKGKKIAIIGAGDAAYDYALQLGDENDVLIINRSDETKCLKLLKNRANDNPRISIFENSTVFGISLEGENLRLDLQQKESREVIAVNYLLITIGREVRFDFMDDTISGRVSELEESGLLYRTGDVRNGKYRQVGISVGDGLLAAMRIGEKLKELNG